MCLLCSATNNINRKAFVLSYDKFNKMTAGSFVILNTGTAKCEN